LAVLALPTLSATMDLSVLFLAVPNLTVALCPSAAISDVYGLLITGSLLVGVSSAARAGMAWRQLWGCVVDGG
jgi:MFS transporter, DHA2 family, multidrug resistance protein